MKAAAADPVHESVVLASTLTISLSHPLSTKEADRQVAGLPAEIHLPGEDLVFHRRVPCVGFCDWAAANSEGEVKRVLIPESEKARFSDFKLRTPAGSLSSECASALSGFHDPLLVIREELR
ncbi:MAG: hypothetical protein MH204_06605 [Fimbriimonadaceae bacterium]|nr:hypothetical protein [Fimbriimonadaceae bacterium]